MRTVKAGDRVVISEGTPRFGGKTAIVKLRPTPGKLFFEFDEYISGHDANGYGKGGHCFFGHNTYGDPASCRCNRKKCLICQSRPAYEWRKL